MKVQKRHRRAASEFLDHDSAATREWIKTGVDSGQVAFTLMSLAAEFAKFETLGERRAARKPAPLADRQGGRQ